MLMSAERHHEESYLLAAILFVILSIYVLYFVS